MSTLRQKMRAMSILAAFRTTPFQELASIMLQSSDLCSTTCSRSWESWENSDLETLCQDTKFFGLRCSTPRMQTKPQHQYFFVKVKHAVQSFRAVEPASSARLEGASTLHFEENAYNNKLKFRRHSLLRKCIFFDSCMLWVGAMMPMAQTESSVLSPVIK